MTSNPKEGTNLSRKMSLLSMQSKRSVFATALSLQRAEADEKKKLRILKQSLPPEQLSCILPRISSVKALPIRQLHS